MRSITNTTRTRDCEFDLCFSCGSFCQSRILLIVRLLVDVLDRVMGLCGGKGTFCASCDML